MGQRINQDEIIGMNIKEARVKAGLSQEQLSAKLQTMGYDISRSTLAKIEVGIRNIKISELKALKKVLKVNYDFMFKD